MEISNEGTGQDFLNKLKVKKNINEGKFFIH